MTDLKARLYDSRAFSSSRRRAASGLKPGLGVSLRNSSSSSLPFEATDPVERNCVGEGIGICMDETSTEGEIGRKLLLLLGDLAALMGAAGGKSPPDVGVVAVARNSDEIDSSMIGAETLSAGEHAEDAR